MGQALKKTFAGAIRPAQPSDIAAIIAIEEDCFPAEEQWPRDTLESYVKFSAKFPAMVPMLIAAPDSDAKGPAGYILGMLMNDGIGEISSLAVTTAYANHGLGRELLKRVSDSLTAAGATKLVLQVSVDNPGAIHLYETSGFVRDKILPGYYQTANGRKDGIEMIRPVKKPAAKPLKP